MKMRIPLATKFAGWLLLNLFLLALGAAAFVGAQFHGGFDSLLAGGAGRRVEALALDASTQLRPRPRSEWDSILEKLSASYGVPISVYQSSGNLVAGPSYDLPVSVESEIGKLGRPPGDKHNGAGPPPRKPPPPPPEKAQRDAFGGRQQHDPPSMTHPASDRPATAGPRHDPPADSPANTRPASEKPAAAGPEHDPAPGSPPNLDSREPLDLTGQPPDPQKWPKFLLHASSPTAYWIGIRVPISNAARGGPMALLIRCTSLAQGGLLLETKPLLIAGAAAVVVSILIWLPFVLALTWQVRRITAATGQVARGNFDVRLPVKRSDELGELASSVNTMAGQLDTFARGQKRFMGDVAHELTSPIARMQTALAILEESGLDRDPTNYYASLREELDEMSRLVAELLEFSKAAMQREIRLGPVSLASLVTDVIHREGGGALLESDVPDALTANAEPKLLARALGNVVRNAVRYAGHAGPILISAAARQGHVELVVTDTGPGVPPESLARLFDAFYRPDAARTREAGGAGLGLAIVKTCVEACGGAVAARNGASCGLEVIMALRTSEPALPLPSQSA
jgi:two-component system sensor histidine kinase CpxA